MWAFLDLDEVFELHARSLREHGGSAGVRDQGLIESALGSARNTFHYADGDAFDIAAAYAFHLAEAQALLDGNKRTGIAAALYFLARNGFIRVPDQAVLDTLYDAMIAIARHEMDKTGLAAVLRRLFS
jgi:death-on-curing protein